MKSKDRQKICTHCDGRIPIESESCLYCGHQGSVSLSESTSAPAPLFDHQSLNDSLSSIPSPPYTNKSSDSMKNDKDKLKQKPLVKENHDNQLNAALGKFNASHSSSAVQVDQKEIHQSSFAPLFFLLAGGNLLIIGLLQFFFSEKGILRLEWNCSYWFLYCLLALPILFFGYKKASDFKENS
ncbi:MAG: hypothetical protein EBZ47_04005 [Chlamydiae bacterium]|nr:hypothetical protein [Chlamydiota bacterium]